MTGLGLFQTLRFLHRALRYRLRTERVCLDAVASLDLEGTVAIDIGAHRGLWCYWLRRAVGAKGKVLAFEPQPEMIEALERFRTSFRARNLDIVPTGLSDVPGEAILRRLGTHSGGASLEHPADAPDAVAYRIPITTLDAYFERNPLPDGARISFVKCDVEGHERRVFLGARKTLQTHRPYLLFECFDEHALEERGGGAVFRDLAALGYRGWILVRGRPIPLERLAAVRSSLEAPFLNYLMAPDERPVPFIRPSG